jgi:hypothetical protein
MGSLNYSGVYPINPAFPNTGLPAPGGVLRFPPQTVEEMQQPGGGSVPGLGSNAIGALLGLAALGAAHYLKQQSAGDSAGATAPDSADPNFRQLTRRPSSQPATDGDQPVTAFSSGDGASSASSDIATGVAEDNPTANLTGDSLAAKASDPGKQKVGTIMGAPSIVPAEGEPPPHDDGDDMCMRQKNKEEHRCYDRKKRSPKWKYLRECLSRASVRWDLCNRTGQIPDEPDEWGPEHEGQ